MSILLQGAPMEAQNGSLILEETCVSQKKTKRTQLETLKQAATAGFWAPHRVYAMRGPSPSTLRLLRHATVPLAVSLWCFTGP